MSRDAGLWLQDIEDRCARVLSYTAAMDLDAFLAASLVRDAIERISRSSAMP